MAGSRGSGPGLGRPHRVLLSYTERGREREKQRTSEPGRGCVTFCKLVSEVTQGHLSTAFYPLRQSRGLSRFKGRGQRLYFRMGVWQGPSRACGVGNIIATVCGISSLLPGRGQGWAPARVTSNLWKVALFSRVSEEMAFSLPFGAGGSIFS